MDELDSVETMFSTGFWVYTQDDNEIRYRSARLLRRPLPGMDRVVNVHLAGEQHFRPIENLRMFARCYKCMHCGSQWAAPYRLEQHQVTCQRQGGPYESKQRFYELLAQLVVVVALEHWYYPYRVTFDLKACLVPVSAGTFTSRHVPVSVSLASNVPGHEGPYNFISNDCPQRLVDDMMACLWDAANCLTRDTMDPYWSQLDNLGVCRGMEIECTRDLEDAETEAGCMLNSSTGVHVLTKVRRALEQWMWCMPVVSFNGDRYDYLLIKPYLTAVYGTHALPWFHCFQAYEGPELSVDVPLCHPGTGMGMR